MRNRKPSPRIKLDERNHVEKPLLDQLHNLGWEILDLEMKQQPQESFRQNFTEVVMPTVLREQIGKINPWMEPDQIEEMATQLTHFPSNNLIKNNQQLLKRLLENSRVSENRHTGEKSPSVRFIDFDTKPLNNNRFIAVCQFKVRILGTEHHIIPDIVLFVNGLPMVVIECKSPKVKDAIAEAIDQMLRYSEQRGATGEGSSPLFYYNQFIVATCRQQAKFGTITTHNEKHFYRWADPFPRTVDELDHNAGSANDQQRLVAGMCAPNNLLEIIQNFTLFSNNDKGETIKIVGRYQQFRAVKLAIQRLLEGKTPRARSGIIWHTQGSGKSLTMMFMVRAMYRHTHLQQWKVLFVTDRTQLEQQLTETSQNIGFSVKVANSINKLKELLRSDSSDLVMAMIHKFRETDLEHVFPELNASHNILVMTDEAHRSQYTMLGSNLDKGIPNATRIGYTGTPIDKTERLFGDYIDKYTMRQAIEDGVTLEILYEGRTHNAEVTDQNAMDSGFADLFSDYKLKERLEILGYGSRNAYLEATSTITAKAKNIIQHYLSHVFPDGFKAQVVATSREAAVRYKQHLDNALNIEIKQLEQNNPHNLDIDQLKRLESDVIISASHNDLPHLKQYADRSRHKRNIKRFKMEFGHHEDELDGNLGIIIVNNMLLTGFDAPIEQVMYLDKVVVAHNLLQAIARVNRVGGQNKNKGFVVDYVGIGHHLKKAIECYDEREQKEIQNNLSFPEDELRDLEANYQAIMDLLKKHKLTDLSDHDVFFDLFYDEDIRFEYMSLFKKFTRSLNLLFPAKEAQRFIKDYNALTEINLLASKHFRDERLSMKGIPKKLRGLTDKYLESKSIDIKVKPISILDENFESQVKKHERPKNKSAEVEHAIRHHLDIELDDDPDLQSSFAEALANILKEFQNNWQKIHTELEKLRERILKAHQEPTYGLDRKKQMPFFRMFQRELESIWEVHPDYSDQKDERISLLVDLTQNVFNTVERELKLTGFWQSAPARNRLKSELLRILVKKEFMSLPSVVKNRAHLISRIMEISERNNDLLLHTK